MEQKCQEVLVRFNSPNHQGVRIDYRQETRCHHLAVTVEHGILHIRFVDKDGDEVRSINYNFSHVLEYDTAGYVK